MAEPDAKGSLQSMAKLLLHVCCAPDATVGLERLGDAYEVTAFFYNPNIHPEAEYELRKREFVRLCQQLGVPYRVGPYDADRWFQLTAGLEDEPEKGRRCEVCFRMRLERAAQEAKVAGCQYFAAVLTVSPHKDARRINDIGAEIGQRFGVQYVPTDLKKKDGFRRSVELSRELGLYRQNYCGCLYSLRSREEAEKRRERESTSTDPKR
jgi:predicted adenine nucleotide alpha hydrolase (AANH) superfamily ATPase